MNLPALKLPSTEALSKLPIRELFKLVKYLTLAYNKAAAERDYYKNMALRDALTGLPNRHGMNAELINAFAKRGDHFLAVILLDIDHFKLVNDTYGHDAGDQVLQTVSDRIQGAIRTGNAMRTGDVVGRTGGEEFAVLLQIKNIYDLAQVAEKIRRTVMDTPIRVTDQNNRIVDLDVTLSAGSSLITGHNGVLTQTDGYKAADEAMYESKKLGRNRVTHTPDAILSTLDAA